jgi:hypothetical protein
VLLVGRWRLLTTKPRRVLAGPIVLLRDDGRWVAALPIAGRDTSREGRSLLGGLVRLGGLRIIVVALLASSHVRRNRGRVLHLLHMLHVGKVLVGDGRPTRLLGRARVGCGHARDPVGSARFASEGRGPACVRRATRAVWLDDGGPLRVLGVLSVVCRRRGRVVRVGV